MKAKNENKKTIEKKLYGASSPFAIFEVKRATF